MTTLMYIAIALAAVIAIVLILAALRPNTFRIERSIDINAPVDKIFPLINDYKNWGSWSPYRACRSRHAADLQRRAERQGLRVRMATATRISAHGRMEIF